MNPIMIQKRVGLSARSLPELEHRIRTLEQAIANQNGVVLAIRTVAVRPNTHRATVHYALQLEFARTRRLIRKQQQ